MPAQSFIVAVLRRPVAIGAWALTVLVTGIWAATQVPVEWVPQVELPEVRITTAWPGASPPQVERYVTAPIERAAQTIAGTERVESVSQEGVSSVVLHVSRKVDLAIYGAQVNDQLFLVRDLLPERVFPTVTKHVPEALRDQRGFITLQLVGPHEADLLRAHADEEIAPRLRSIPGVADIEIAGGAVQELRVTLDPDRLASLRLNPTVVRTSLVAATKERVYGRFHERGRASLVFTPSEEDLDALRALPIREAVREARVLRLGDVASVEVTTAPTRSISRIDGHPVVTITVERARGSHMLAVARDVHERVAALAPGLPAYSRLVVADDRSAAVRNQLQALGLQGGLGLVLVLLVLVLTLQHARAVLVVVSSVAVSLAVTSLLFWLLKLSLNMITIAGLVLVFGLLVDNAVIVIEQIQDRRSSREPIGEIIRVSTASVLLPLLGGTLTTGAVIIPLVYLSGELRPLFVPFGALVCMTLLASLVVAGTVVPVLMGSLPRFERAGSGLLAQRGQRLAALVYSRVARFPRVTLLILILLVGTPFWKLPAQIPIEQSGRPRPFGRLVGLYNDVVGSDAMLTLRRFVDPALGGVARPFFRNVDFDVRWYDIRPELYVRLSFPPGNPIQQADTLLRRFERTALASPSTKRTIARISESQATLRVLFHDDGPKRSAPYILRERLIRMATQLGGVGVSIGGLLPEGYNSGFGAVGSDLRIEATGPNYEELETLSRRLAEFLKERSRRVADVRSGAGRFGQDGERDVLRIEWRARSHARTGISALRMTDLLRPVFVAGTPSFFTPVEEHNKLPVRIVMLGAKNRDLEHVMSTSLRFADVDVQLGAFGDAVVASLPADIERENQQYKRYIVVDYRGPYQLGQDFLKKSLLAFATPAGYRLAPHTFMFFAGNVRTSLIWVLLGTLGLVYLITAAVFESWRMPFLVMLGVPTAWIGLAICFLFTEVRFAEGAFIGVVLLAGVAVNDSILLVHRFSELRRQSVERSESVVMRLAIRQRLRPMWTTTLTSVVAMLPLVVLSSDSEFWSGLAVAVIGGLLASTLLSPAAALALVTVFDRRRTKPGASKKRWCIG